MKAEQKIVWQRRQYNQWVGSQTVEDFALRFTAVRARRWSAFEVGNTALGAVSFLACEAIGGSITLAFGFTNAIAAIIATGLMMFAIGLPICLAATRYGVDVDLLTRGAGFGYIGSTVTSLIYASFTFILFSIEASIMSAALTIATGIPGWAANIISALVVIPIAAFGIRAISRMQLWTQPIWLILQFGPLLYLGVQGLPDFSAWTQFSGGEDNPGFSLLPFGMAASILLSLLPQIGEQVDYLRFLPERSSISAAAWWGSLLFAGPGWVITGCAKLAAGSFLTYLATERGVTWQDAAQPATMYLIALLEVFHNHAIALSLMLIFVITCQIKINSTNAYAGSIAWSNFFSRLTHAHPGRVVWVIFNVLLALLLMEIGIFRVIQSILGLYADFAVGWLGALAADLVINKPLGLSPKGIEFKRAYLFDINPVGVGAMAASVVVSTAMSFSLFGDTPRALAPFAGLFVAFATAPLIAWATKGKYYLARKNDRVGSTACVICEGVFEEPDMASCPAYGGNICSLCCSLDARCGDLCKLRSRVLEQIIDALPSNLINLVDPRIAAFIGVLFSLTLAISAILGLVGFEYGTVAPSDRIIINTTLIVVFFVLFILAAMISWALVLTHFSRRAAEAETSHQTQMLMQEISAHEQTDAALVKAKAVAESANTAKSRYIVGVIHEIRAPLNAIFGYAQLLERGSTMRPGDAVRIIRRSAEHLSNLVDGLLDISQIETGSLQIHRDRVNFTEFLDQISDMFRLASAAKGIFFTAERQGHLPAFIHTDEKRLRQILVNLLSNAVKYTDRGGVTFRVVLRGQVAEFEISDSGLGIRPEDIENIFEPFERGHMAAANAIPGTGLGLTISRLLTQILGGELTVVSSVDKGSTFRVRMLLSEAKGVGLTTPEQRITGYTGKRQRILLTDDDQEHIDLLREILSPLGFIIRCTRDGDSSLDLALNFLPDLVILDIAMPGISGLETAKQLRARGIAPKILIMSGNFHNAPGRSSIQAPDYDAFLAKPTDVRALLGKIQHLLGLSWIYEVKSSVIISSPDPINLPRPAVPHLLDLLQLGRIGYIKGIEAKLSEIADADPEMESFVSHLRMMVRKFALTNYVTFLESLPEMQTNE